MCSKLTETTATKRLPVIALAGNPNAGKTVLFNRLTGHRQAVGNWPGVTVEKRMGRCSDATLPCQVIDLPGTYSLAVTASESAMDSRIACEYLISNEADLIVNVIDASNLERNLYLTAELVAMGKPMVCALNMMDVVQKQGVTLDLNALERKLGCPVVALVAREGEGMDALYAQIKNQLRRRVVPHQVVGLSPNMLAAHQALMTCLIESGHDDRSPHIDVAWLALRMLVGDRYAASFATDALLQQRDAWVEQIASETGETPDTLLACLYYDWAHALVQSVRQRVKQTQSSCSDWIDRIVLHRYCAIPVFLLVMYLMFVFSINVGGAFQDFFDITSQTVFVDGFAHALLWFGVPHWLVALLANGVGKGLNTVMTFIPILAGMFFFLSFLEDSGYMARAAFVMDRLMRALGLPGKSFVPMIVGFGCNVPAVMGARSLDGARDRILTIMMMPFMSCGARLAIFAVFASAFFPKGGQNIIFLLYLTGIVAAVGTGMMLRKTVLVGEAAPFVLELPQYHRPRLGSLCRQTWHRLKQFIFRAGRVIVPVCVLIGGLNAVTLSGKAVHHHKAAEHSILSLVGRTITPVLAPMGITQDNWPATVGLMTGVLAKEVVVGTLNTLYSQQAGHVVHQAPLTLSAGMSAAFQSIPDNLIGLGSALGNPLLASAPLQAMDHPAHRVMVKSFHDHRAVLAYMLFVLLYFPCVSTMAAIKRELSTSWAVYSVVWTTSLAYAVSVIVYQVAGLYDAPWHGMAWILGMLGYLGITIIWMKHYIRSRQG